MFTCSNRIHEQWKQYTVCHSTAPCLEVDREVPVCNHCTPNSRKLHQVTNRNLQICEALSGVNSILVPPIKMVLDVDAIAIMQISTADNMNLKFKCKRKSINHCTNVYWKFHYSLFINHDTTYFSSFSTHWSPTVIFLCTFFLQLVCAPISTDSVQETQMAPHQSWVGIVNKKFSCRREAMRGFVSVCS